MLGVIASDCVAQAGDDDFPMDIVAKRRTSIYHKDGDVLKRVNRGFKMTALGFNIGADGTVFVKVEYGGFIFKDIGYVPADDVKGD